MEYLYNSIVEGIIILLIVVNWFWVKRYIHRHDEQEKVWGKEGGVVTRQLHYLLCNDHQAKCLSLANYKAIENWKEDLIRDGGVLTKNEHAGLCNDVVEGFGAKLTKEFEHHRELMAAELKLIRGEITLVRSEIANNILSGINNMKKDILQEIIATEKRGKQ